VATELTAVIAALEREVMYVWPHGRGWKRIEAPCLAWRGEIDGSDVLIIVSGMGEAAVTRAVRWLLAVPVGQASLPANHSPRPQLTANVPGGRCASAGKDACPTGKPPHVFSIGFAGALTDVPIGTLIDPIAVLDESGASLPLPGTAGRLVTVSGVSGSAHERDSLRARTQADAVDMESFHVVRECQAHGVPVRSLRAVSDTPTRGIPPDLAAIFSGESVSILSLLWAVLRRPWRVFDLWRLASDSAVAARVLADALSRALKCSPKSCSTEGPAPP
jgi:nucleoside phosphorylase